MRRLLLIVSVALLVAATGVAPAVADIDSNPNVEVLEPVECDGGLAFDAVWSPTTQSVVGQDPDSNAIGVAKEFWLTDEFGTKLVLFSRPLAPGLVGLTVFCWWPSTDSPTGFVGGEILFSGNVRP